MKRPTLLFWGAIGGCILAGASCQPTRDERPRVLISTDIGGTDPDDNQSLTHLMMYSDLFRLEGLISSPSFGKGSKEEILRMIDLYAEDYPALSAHVAVMPPDSLRAIAKQGKRDEAPLAGFSTSTEGSEWIVRCARKNDKQPLWVLVWGCLEDVAQALHDAPDIADKIRIYWIGGPNKKWGSNGYNYIVTHFPHLWMIENNATYRGFIGSAKDTSCYQAPFYERFMKGHGTLGNDFIHYYNGIAKMGDTPSLLYLMGGFDADRPDTPHWGGQFAPMSASPKYLITGALTEADTVPVYSLMEWRLQGPVLHDVATDSVCFILRTDKQNWRGYYEGDGCYVVRYAPKAPVTLTYSITSQIAGFPVHEGAFVVGEEWPAVGRYQSHNAALQATPIALGNTWWTDSANPSWQSGESDDTAQGGGNYASRTGKWQGAATIARWRNDIMRHWAARFAWLH